jgi:pimeloyl-ACP methyl ester carboxylesterase
MSSTTQSVAGLATVFTERFVQADGLQIRCLEAGQGSSVVILQGGEGLTQSSLHTLLARHFRVIVLEIAGFGQSPIAAQSSAMRNMTRTLAHTIATLGLEHYVLVSPSTSTPLALWQAIEAPAGIDALVLISPAASGFTGDSELEYKLREVQIPTLILIGTNDTTIPPETGRLYVERLPNCYYMLVYDAGRTIAAERPEALLVAVCDFVERRGTFIVERNSTAINP